MWRSPLSSMLTSVSTILPVPVVLHWGYLNPTKILKNYWGKAECNPASDGWRSGIVFRLLFFICFWFFSFHFIETQIVSIFLMEVVFTDDGGPSIVSELNQPKHK